MNLDEVFREDDMISTRSMEVEWSVTDSAPQLVERLFSVEPSVRAVVDALRNKVPVIRTHKEAKAAPFHRPSGHGRSYYLHLGEISSGAKTAGCLAFKGTEIACDDFAQSIEAMASQRDYIEVLIGDISAVRANFKAEIPRIDRWPVVEHKVPGAISLREALDEARIALELQQAHFERYGELARVPFPLMVMRWSEEEAQRVQGQIAKHLCSRGIPVMEAEIRGGLGVYVYYYPQLPVRLQHLDFPEYDPEGRLRLPASPFARRPSYRARAVALKEMGINVQEVLERWIELTVRIFALGFLPKNPASLISADCLQAWNVVLDGGIVDLDSLQKMSEVRDEREFHDNFRRAIRELTLNACLFLMGWPFNAQRFRDRVPEMHWIVWSDVVRRLEAERQRGALDPRLEPLLRARSTFNDLEELFSELYP